jgi:hypothetical protein
MANPTAQKSAINQKQHERNKRAAAAEELAKANKVRPLIAKFKEAGKALDKTLMGVAIRDQWPEQKQVRVITKSMRSQARRHMSTVDLR